MQKYSNSKDAKVGDTIIARDNGGNLVSGTVQSLHPDGKHLRIASTPILIESVKAVLAEDAYANTMPAAAVPAPPQPLN